MSAKVALSRSPARPLSNEDALSALFGCTLGRKTGKGASIGLLRSATESADELTQRSPETRVCLDAQRNANQKHQKTRFQLVHDSGLRYATGVPCFLSDL